MDKHLPSCEEILCQVAVRLGCLELRLEQSDSTKAGVEFLADGSAMLLLSEHRSCCSAALQWILRQKLPLVCGGYFVAACFFALDDAMFVCGAGYFPAYK